MGKQRESRLSLNIQNALKKKYGADIFIFKVHGSEFMMAGLPDLIGCFRGQGFAFETKMPEGGNPSERQMYVCARMRRAGYYVDVPRSVAEALEMFQRRFVRDDV